MKSTVMAWPSAFWKRRRLSQVGKTIHRLLIEVPVKFRRRGVEAKLVVLDQPQDASEPDANLVKALTRAHEWWGRIVCGEAKGVGEIARAERFNRAYVTRFLCLAFLAPEITKAILEGNQPTRLTSKRLIRSALKTPLLWHDQIAFVLPETRIKPSDR